MPHSTDTIIRNLQRIPREIFFEIIQIGFTETQVLEMIQFFPGSKQFKRFLKHGTDKVVILFARKRKSLPNIFKHRLENHTQYVVYIPDDLDLENITLQNSGDHIADIQDQLHTILPDVMQSMERDSNCTLNIDFAFDMENRHCYKTCSIYPYIFDQLKAVGHSLNLYKNTTEDPTLFTKSKNETISIMNSIIGMRSSVFSLRDINNSRSVYSTIISPTMMLKGQRRQVRSTLLFHDVPNSLRLDITRADSKLCGVNIITPIPESQQGTLPGVRELLKKNKGGPEDVITADSALQKEFPDGTIGFLDQILHTRFCDYEESLYRGDY